LTREQARAAIVKPAEKFYLVVEPSLVEQLLDDLWADGVDPSELQLVCHHLHRTLSPVEHFISQRHYLAIGGAEAVRRNFLDLALRQIPWRDRPLAWRALREMVLAGEQRASVSEQRLMERLEVRPGALERVLWELYDLGLVRRVDEEPGADLELAHDLVAGAISARLGERETRPSEVRTVLQRELRAWRDSGQLLSPETLKKVAEAREEIKVSSEEWELIVRSCAAHEMELEPWMERMPALGEEQLGLIAELLVHPSEKVRSRALAEGSRLAEKGYASRLLSLIPPGHEGARKEAEVLLQRSDRSLAQALKSPDTEARRQTVTALAKIGSEHAAKPLLKALEDRDPVVRQTAAQAIEEVGGEKTADLLIRRLASDPGHNRWEIAKALVGVASKMHPTELVKKLGPGSGGPLAALRALLPPVMQPLLGGIEKTVWAGPLGDYVVGRTLVQRRDIEAGRNWLKRARRACRTAEDRQAIEEALSEAAQVEALLNQGHFRWEMFRKTAAHSGHTPEQVIPPLVERWRVNLQEAITASPVVSRGCVYVVTRKGTLYALDVRSGNVLWEFKSGQKAESSPAAGEGVIYLGCDSGLIYALSADEGKVVWRRRHPADWRSPATVSADRILLGAWDGTLYCLGTKAGQLLWQADTGAEIFGAPAVAEGRVVCANWGGLVLAYALQDGRELWRYQTQGEVWSSPACAAGKSVISSDDGAVYCLDAETGGLVWRHQLNGRVRSSPAVCEDRLVVGASDGALHCLDYGSGAPLWAMRTEEEIVSSPAIADKVVYVGSRDGSLYACALESGEILWRQASAYAVLASPAVAEGLVIVPMRHSEVCAFGMESNPEPQ